MVGRVRVGLTRPARRMGARLRSPRTRRMAVLALLAAPALILGLLGMHVLTGIADSGHATDDNHVVALAEPAGHSQQSDQAGGVQIGCDTACQTGHAGTAMTCLLILVAVAVTTAAMPRLIGFLRGWSRLSLRVVVPWPPAPATASPPDLTFLAVSRT